MPKHLRKTKKFPRTASNWLALTVTLAVVLACYFNCLTNEFVLGDRALIETNGRQRLQTARQNGFGAAIEEIFFRPNPVETDTGRTYRPVAVLSLLLEYSLWRSNPFGYRQTNVALHAATALLLYWLTLRISGRTGLALAVATVFAAHPVATTAVAAVANRGALLATALSTASVCLFVAAATVAPTARGAATVLYALSTASFALAALSAEPALPVAAVAAAYLLALENKLRRQSAGAPWCAAMAAVAALCLLLRHAAMGAAGETATAAAAAPPAAAALWGVRAAGAFVLGWALPRSLTLEHPLAEGPAWLSAAQMAVGVLAVAAVVFFLWRSRRAAPAIWLGTAWATVVAAAVCGAAARAGSLSQQWLYVAGPGVSMAGCAVAHRLWQRRAAARVSGRSVAALTTVVVVGLAWQTVRLNRDWRNEAKLLAQLVAASPKSASARLNYGQALARSGRWPEAIAQLRESVALAPQDAAARTELGIALGEAGRLAEAIAEFEQALRLQPGNARYHFNLAVAYGKNRQYREAILGYQRALSAGVFLPDAANNLAWLMATCPEPGLRNGTQAVELARLALQAYGEDDAEALDTLAAALAEAGQFLEAARTAERAVQLAAARGATDRAAEIRARLKLYLAGQPYRERR